MGLSPRVDVEATLILLVARNTVAIVEGEYGTSYILPTGFTPSNR